MLSKIKTFIRTANLTERINDVTLHEEKIYTAFYNRNIGLTDLEISQVLESVSKRIKKDLQERKVEREMKFLMSEKAIDNLKYL